MVKPTFNGKNEALKDGGSDQIAAQTITFSFRELAAATKYFRADCLLGEGGFGQVYKGRLESINQVNFRYLFPFIGVNMTMFKFIATLNSYYSTQHTQSQVKFVFVRLIFYCFISSSMKSCNIGYLCYL